MKRYGEFRDSSGGLRDLPLRVVEISRNSDDSIVNMEEVTTA